MTQLFMQIILNHLLTYSKEKGQVANIKKTVYIHFSDNPNTTPILINSHDYISGIEFGKSHKYLGMSCHVVKRKIFC